MTDLESGQRFSHYSILARLGSGGMGVIYKALDLNLKRTVALKLLLDKEGQSGSDVQRFLREAESAAALNHPRIAHVYEVAESDGIPFIAMEYLPGGSLRERTGAAPPSVEEALRWSCEIAEALAVAHRHGIVHRDIKPTNVLLDEEGHTKLADFGLAKRLPAASERKGDTGLTTAGVILGTPDYMSPEQALGENVGPPTDIFSLGCLIYELIADRPPFKRTTTIDTLHAVVHDAPPPLGGRNIPPELDPLLRGTLEKDPEKRPTAADLSRQLRGLVQSTPEASEAPTAVRRREGTRSSSRRRALVPALALAAVGIALLGWWWIGRSPPLDFKERETVMIGGIVNTTGETALEGSLQTALQISLEQSTYVNVLSPERVRQALKRMRRNGEEKLSEPAAREVCQREGARALLTGNIDRIGTRYVLTVRVVDPRTGSAVRTLTEQAPTREEILPALDLLARAVRQALGESLGSISQTSEKLAEVTTPSLEALQLFTEGAALQKDARLVEARALYERALELDPEFARAYAGLATTYRSMGFMTDDALAERYFQEALKRLEKVGERERLEIEGMYHGVMGRYENAVRLYQLLIERYPNDDEYHISLARQYVGLSRHQEAITEYEKALSLNPRSSGTLISMAASYGYLRQFRRQAAYLERAFAIEPNWETDETQNHQYGWALLLAGEEQGARQAFEKMLAQGGSKKARGHRSLGILALYRGEMKAAAEQLEQAAQVNDAFDTPGSSARDVLYLAEALALVERHEEALSQLAHAADFLERSGYQPAFVGLRISVGYSRLGRSDAAARLVETVREKSPSVNQWDLIRAEGELLLSRGDAEDGVETLRRAYLASNEALTLASLGRALVLAGRREDAIEAYRELVSRPPLAWDGHVEWALAHLKLGKLYEERGDVASARAAYVKFLEIWKEGDSDLPPVLDARKAVERLSAGPS
jgi:serine/threonine protein kinase/tetratricopeptide (TPR) repeat protein